jgi:phosphatidate cytidylyltransferase
VIAPDQRDAGAGVNKVASTGEANNLRRRVASTFVLAPVAIATAYIGGWLFFIVWLAAAAGILWEWTLLVLRRADPAVLTPGAAALIAATMFTGLGEPRAATLAVAAGAVLAGLSLGVFSRGAAPSTAGIWAALGVIYAGIAFLGPALLRRDNGLGFVALLFLFATVWVSDVFSYFVGRAVGGPLLWPLLSPNKTWAGAVGGLVGGSAGGTLVAYASGVGNLAAVGGVALVLSVLAQAGDLLESAIKRRFGAKDAGRLIPGHGGLMDRLDGFLVAAMAALVIGLLRRGADAPAHGLLIW